MKKKLLQLFAIPLFSLGLNAQVSNQKINDEFNKALKLERFISPEEVQFVITSSYTSKHNGVTHVYANQIVNGVEIMNVNADMHLSKEGNMIAYHHNFIPNLSQKAIPTQQKLTAIDALNKGLLNEGMVPMGMNQKAPIIEMGKMVWFDPSISSEKLAVKGAYFAQADKISLIWQTEFYNDETHDWWNIKVDAISGEILEKINYTNFCNPSEISSHIAHPKNSFIFEDEPQVVLGKKASSPQYNVFPLPLESPARGPRELVSNTASANASPYGWHDTDGVVGNEFMITRGNNVWAKDDTLANNGTSGGFSPNGGDSLIFDFPYDVKAKPRNNLSSAIVNLFYWNNIIHDIMFEYGFNEEAGNFQQKNYSGKGLGKDFVNADAQDGSGTSNANFSTPVDGQNGRMQMYLWPTSGAATSNNTLGVISPSSIKGVFYGPQSVAGPRLSANGLKGKIVLVLDGNGTTSNGCDSFSNASEIAGNIALIDRSGSCGTQSATNRTKIKKAQAAGAIAVIFAHATNGITPTAVNGTDNAITIPSITIGYGTGVMIKTALQSDSVIAILFDSSEYNTATVYDSDLDNGVIAHEYGHGISTRLTGGPANSSCLGNQEQAGEGWSDFFALALTTRTWETSTGAARGIGTWVIDEDSTGLGIRDYRYSRNMTINPMTYNRIKTLSVPHGVGSVFCTMLYDIYWDMIDLYGFDPDWYNGNGGNNKTMQLVIDGLKLQKCNPGFVDMRNAIILADSINNNGIHKDLLWKAFARRGLGFYANQGSSTSRTDGTESFALPPVTGLNQVNQDFQYRMYPNPSHTQITVDVFGGAKISGIEIFDITGKSVQTETFSNTNLPSATLHLNNHPKGYYLVKVESTEGVSFQKLLID
ncbi:MAG: M36 family metallopeptidase [Bacteroidia bacterium]|nr:M36 family metallopeptidase [Bacteroidia bacterium]MCF8445373.1 M36 family metallopeptidase [Bacteroidia bacterium]